MDELTVERLLQTARDDASHDTAGGVYLPGEKDRSRKLVENREERVKKEGREREYSDTRRVQYVCKLLQRKYCFYVCVTSLEKPDGGLYVKVS